MHLNDTMRLAVTRQFRPLAPIWITRPVDQLRLQGHDAKGLTQSALVIAVQRGEHAHQAGPGPLRVII